MQMPIEQADLARKIWPDAEISVSLEQSRCLTLSVGQTAFRMGRHEGFRIGLCAGVALTIISIVVAMWLSN